MESPLLSVCLITYNHVDYIEQALKGVLMQKVKFTWELIIADDYSTDGTRDILIRYKEKYPQKIKLILQEKNVGAAQNWFDLMYSPKSKYIAYFEGDDYWINPNKLQIQVNMLEKNPDYVMCFHNAEYKFEDKDIKASYFHKGRMKNEYNGNDLLKMWLMPTASVLMKNVIPPKFPSYFDKATHGDLALFLYASQFGIIGYIPAVMSVYRIGSAGVTNNFNGINHNLSHIEQCFNMKVYFKSNYQFLLSKRISEYYLSTARLYVKVGNKREAFKCLKKAFVNNFLRTIFNTKELSKLIFELVNA